MCSRCQCSQQLKEAAYKVAPLTMSAAATDPEFEECRRCLEPGLYRRCCDNFYCNDCYYRIGECPSCGAKSGSGGSRKSAASKEGNDEKDEEDKLSTFQKKKKKRKATQATAFQLLLLLLFKAFAWLLLPVWFIVWGVNKITAPTTLHGFQCVGLFPQCKYEICYSLYEELRTSFPYFNESLGTCGTSQNCRRVCSKACVIDDRLYSLSEGKLGLDVCTETATRQTVAMHDSFETEAEAPSNDTRAIPNSLDLDINAQFQQNDETLSSIWNVNIPGNPSFRQSVFWDDATNANPSDICGSSKGEHSLVFTGQNFRYAESVDFNLLYGGILSFSFKLEGYHFCAFVTTYDV